MLDTDLIARFIFSLLPHKPPYRLVMDRTNWKFGSKDINILVLDIVYKCVAFPKGDLVNIKEGGHKVRFTNQEMVEQDISVWTTG